MGPIVHSNKKLSYFPEIIPFVKNKFIFDKKAAQIFVSGTSDHCPYAGASEDRKFVAKPTQSNVTLFFTNGISLTQ